MKELLSSPLGRLRILGFLEGLSLLVLIFIAVPMKYVYGNPIGSEVVGPIHGVLFILFVVNTMYVSAELDWKFSEVTWKVLLACVVPFGTFYVDSKILNKG